ncbi:hypothetical protein Tco_1018931 [Tanacetum coccineum]|uniref:Uncharacterized protein n=1 Tax=Tanacetum coccineum TaxID=301880 RepID=A0ABQ5FVR0_9ASTR
MSDSEHSTVTYTSVYEDDLYMGSPGVEVPIYEVPQSPDYIPGPEGPPSPDYVPGPILQITCPAHGSQEASAFHILHTFCSGACLLGVSYRIDDEEDDEGGGNHEEDPSRLSLCRTEESEDDEAPTPFLFSSPLPQIPSPPLPIPPPPPIIPTYAEESLGSRAAGIRRRDALPSPIHETEIPEMWLPLRKRLCRTTPGPRCEVGESSAAGAARQFGPTTAEADLYGFTDMLEAAPGRQMSRELGYGIRDTWDDLVGAIQEIAPTTLEGVNQRVIELSSTVDEEDEIIYSQLDDARYDRALLRARVNMLESDRPFHGRTAILMEEEARLSRAAWAQSMDVCDQTHSEGILLRTTVMTQQSEIVELRAADQRRQTVISELLKADYRRQRQLVETLKIVKSLKAQMIEIQRQQGPAKDPAEPELPEEAGSST